MNGRIWFGAFAVMMSLSAVACDVDDSAPDEEEPTGELAMKETDEGVVGDFERGDAVVHFESRFVEEQVIAIDVELNGLTISALADLHAGVIEYDGFATENAGDTQMTDADREVLLAFKGALDELGEDAEDHVVLMRRFVGTWAEFPSTLSLEGQALADTEKSYSSICHLKNTYQAASHDCSGRDWWSDGATIDNAYVSMHAAGPCSDGTYFLKNGVWQCYEPDHDSSVEYAYGNCLGRCGAGCGSDTQLTWDCLDHDECVRVGHATASWWCDDQFASTTDDWAAAPSCGM